jgi:hypothetical protein
MICYNDMFVGIWIELLKSRTGDAFFANQNQGVA